MIHAYASQPNYWRHLAPIVDELRARGHDVTTWAARAPQPWGARIPESGFRKTDSGPVIVASWLDAQKARERPVVYVEHGAGQTYVDGTGECYPGSPGLDHVRLFITPGRHVADRWHATYPEAEVATVGCPALDRHLRWNGPARPFGPPLVAVTAHWRCGVNAETMPALPLYEKALREIARRGTRYALLGHAHPRAGRRASAMWAKVGIPFEVDPDVVLATASLVVADNTSLMYEAAALGIPVLALNAPTYRRDVEHGLRFWSHVPGLQVDDPCELEAGIVRAVADPPEARALRAEAAGHVYAHRDGRSSARAVDALERLT